MNTLTPAQPGARSSSGRSCTLSRVPPMKKAKSQCMRWRPAFTFAVKVASVTVKRIGVRHFEHRGDAAHHSAARTGFEILLVGEAGLAKMHLGVHHAGQDVQALAVDHLGGRGLAERADFGDAAVPEADIAHALAVLIDHGAGFQNHVKVLGHLSSNSTPHAEEARKGRLEAWNAFRACCYPSRRRAVARLLRMRSLPGCAGPCSRHLSGLRSRVISDVGVSPGNSRKRPENTKNMQEKLI